MNKKNLIDSWFSFSYYSLHFTVISMMNTFE